MMLGPFKVAVPDGKLLFPQFVVHCPSCLNFNPVVAGSVAVVNVTLFKVYVMLSVVSITVSIVQLPDGLVLPIIEITWDLMLSEKRSNKSESSFNFICILIC